MDTQAWLLVPRCISLRTLKNLAYLSVAVIAFLVLSAEYRGLKLPLQPICDVAAQQRVELQTQELWSPRPNLQVRQCRIETPVDLEEDLERLWSQQLRAPYESCGDGRNTHFTLDHGPQTRGESEFPTAQLRCARGTIPTAVAVVPRPANLGAYFWQPSHFAWQSFNGTLERFPAVPVPENNPNANDNLLIGRCAGEVTSSERPMVWIPQRMPDVVARKVVRVIGCHVMVVHDIPLK